MNQSNCTAIRLDDFLENRLTEAEQTAFERHLDQCERCCHELQRRTAHAVEWSDTRRFLGSSLLDDQDIGMCAASDEIAAIDSRGADSAISSERLPSLDFLVPTDDPRMLGRFAGYEITGVIGCGGMGIVLKGFDQALNRYAAIKVLAPHFATSGASRQRFAREGQAAAAVVHDNVIAIHGVSEFNGLPYLVMPYVKGTSLQKRIDREGLLSIEEVLRIAMQTARGLAAAHDQGLVHRDIKPANILLPENVERVLITDFGLARAADDASLTRSGVIAGTPQYMSPEQARGEGIDHRSDLFSLGCVIYAMTAGHPPFRAETPYGILRRITDTPHRPLHEIRSDVPDWFCTIINRLLEKNAANRYPTADVVAGLLENCLAHVQQPRQAPLPTELRTIPKIQYLRSWSIVTGMTLALGIAGATPYLHQLFKSVPDQSSITHDHTLPATNNDEHAVSESIPIQSDMSHPASDVDLQWDSNNDIDALENSLKVLATPKTR